MNERAKLTFDDVEEIPKTKPTTKRGRADRRALTALAVEEGFTRVHGPVDGRKLRAKGRTAQLNFRVKPDIRERFWSLAAGQGLESGEDLLVLLMDHYERGE